LTVIGKMKWTGHHWASDLAQKKGDDKFRKAKTAADLTLMDAA